MKLEHCVFRVGSIGGQPQGTGFVIIPTLGVTCVHVVEDCGVGSGELLRLVFQAGDAPVEAEVLTDGWYPEEDVAFLRLHEFLPEGVIPAVLGPSAGQERIPVQAFGYPDLGGVEGLWADGRFIACVSEEARTLLQLRATQITVGFSGGPVWAEETGQVIGMVTQIAVPDRYERLGDVAFATPAEMLHELRPDEVSLQPPRPVMGKPTGLRIGAPFQAPPLPPHFVPRPEACHGVKPNLLATETSATGILVVSAIQGMGGIGKSILATALSHDEEVRHRFKDGILWATLGEQAEILSRLSEWIQALGDYSFYPTTIEGASSQLRTLLQGSSCLLVVDDAWQADHVRPFLVGGDHCQVLITTRDAGLARKLGADLYNLDVMTEKQAVALFEKRLGRLGSDRKAAEKLARELGYLPLALELAAAQIEAGVTWSELLAALRQGLADLAALDLDEAAFRNESLRLSFQLSLQRLSHDDLKAFIWLGVLPEDVHLNPSVAATLWGEAKREARKRLRRLRDKALLRQIGRDLYTLHDLLYHEARLRLENAIPLPKAHASLLNRYRRKVTHSRWDHLPDDRYIHAHLIWHMEQASQIEAIHALLRLGTDQGQNAWYEAQERLGQTANYLDDVSRAWRAADKEEQIGLQCRYALITTSLNSLAANLPAGLLADLVETGQWTSLQGLASARQIPEPYWRALALATLAPHLEQEQRTQALEEALISSQELGLQGARATLLRGLIPHLPEDLLAEAVTSARSLGAEGERAQVLAAVAHRLAGKQRTDVILEAMAAARRTWERSARARALAAVIPLLPEVQRVEILKETLAAAYGVKDEVLRVQALASVLPLLSGRKKEAVLKGALDVATNMRAPWARAQAFTSLIHELAPQQRASLLREALVTARKLRSGAVAILLSELSPYLTGDLLRDALHLAYSMEDRTAQVRALGALVSFVPEKERALVRAKALALAREIGDKEAQQNVLARLVLFIPEELLTAAFDTVGQTEYEEVRAHALSGLAPQLPAVFASAWKVTEEKERARLLVNLIPYLYPFGQEMWHTVGEVLAVARETGDRTLRAQVLKVVSDLQHQRSSDHTQAAMWESLGDRARMEPLEYLSEVRKIVDHRSRVNALIDLLPLLPEEQKKNVAEEALNTTQMIGHQGLRAFALERMIKYLDSPELGKMLIAAGDIRSRNPRVRVISSLVPSLVALPFASIYPIWCMSSHTLAARTRSDLLADINALMPVISALGGQDAVAETFCAIQDVGRWWP